MSGLLRFSSAFACILAHAVGATEIDPGTGLAQSETHLAGEHARQTPPHRRAQLPPMLRPVVAADPAHLAGDEPLPLPGGLHPAAETLTIGRCDAADPPPRL